MKRFLTVLCAICISLIPLCLAACGNDTRYALTVNGDDYLYESLKTTYKAGEEVTVKAKIKPYEGVKVALDTKQLVKVKSTQNDYWQFTFEMPSHDATLDIKTFKGFDEPILYGFYLTFNDKDGNPIEALSKPVDDKDAVADYAVIYYEDNHKVVSSNEGANVFADGKQKISNVGYELEDTLYFTRELIDAVACVDWVYIDEVTQQVYSYGGAGYKLDNIGGVISTANTQNLSDRRYTGQMKEYEEKFDSSVKLNFVYVDYLTGVKVLEYGANNALIKSTEITKAESENAFIVSENCEYAVIEEEYTDTDGLTHFERTLINKSKTGGGRTLKFPRGDGLISPVYLSIKWQNEE